MVSVASWAHRTLRGISRYHHCRDEPDHCRVYATWAEEELVGVYENPPKTEPSSIVITERGLYWRVAGVSKQLEFAQIRTIRGPSEKTAAELKIELVDGSSQTVRVEGSDGKYRDVFAMVRFLARVTELERKKRKI